MSTLDTPPHPAMPDPVDPDEVPVKRARVTSYSGDESGLATGQMSEGRLRRSFPESTFVAPWISAVLSGEDDNDPAQREAGLVDACAVIGRCDGIVLCGGRISSGMEREQRAAVRSWDLTGFAGVWDGEPLSTTGVLGPFDAWARNLEVRP